MEGRNTLQIWMLYIKQNSTSITRFGLADLQASLDFMLYIKHNSVSAQNILPGAPDSVE